MGVENKILVQGATELVVTDLLKPESEKQLRKIFGRGLDNRLMRSNDINETSSRSHLVFIFRTTKRNRKTGKITEGKLTFIDLAGSERTAYIDFDEHLYEEALFINESLAFLGRIFYLLSLDEQIPLSYFKQTILTHLLVDSIGNQARTALIVNMSPSNYDIKATKDTLEFAEMTGFIKRREGLIMVEGTKTYSIKVEMAQTRQSKMDLVDIIVPHI